MKLVLSVMLLLVSFSTLAGTVLPEITRSGKILNPTPSGVVWDTRKVVGMMADYDKGKSKSGASESKALSVMLPYAFYSFDKFSFQGLLGYFSGESTYSGYPKSKYDGTYPLLYAGMRLTDNVGIGAGFVKFHSESKGDGYEGNNDQTTLHLAASFRFGARYFAVVGVESNNEKGEYSSYGTTTTEPELKYEEYYAGVGYQRIDQGTRKAESAELSLHHHGKATATNALTTNSVGKSTTVILDYLRAYGPYEFRFRPEFEKSTNSWDGSETESFNVALLVEYELTSEFYLTPMFAFTRSYGGYNNNISKSTSRDYTLTAGYRAQPFDFDFAYTRSNDSYSDDDKFALNFLYKL